MTMNCKHTTYLTSCLVAGLLAMAVVACSTDAAGDGDSPLAAVGEPVVFALALNPSATRAEVANRTIDNTWPANKTVTIRDCVGDSTHTFTTGDAPSTVSTTATALTATDGNFIWPVNDPQWEFEAWYPSGDAPATTLTVAADQSAITDDVFQGYDLLYCPPTAVTFRQRPVTLTFLHQMARVVVIVNSDYTNTKEKVTEITFGGGKAVLKGTISSRGTTPNTNGETTWTASTEAGYINKTVTMRPYAAETNTSMNTYAFECILPPQRYPTEGALTTVASLVHIASEKKPATEGKRQYHYDGTINLQAGYQYTYNLLISEQGVITLATVKVTDWIMGTPVSGNASVPSSSYPSTTIQ